MRVFYSSQSFLAAVLRKLGSGLVAVSLTTGLLLSAHVAQAEQVVLEEGNVVGINDLVVQERLGGSTLYDVGFVFASGKQIYGGAGRDFQFPVEEDAVLALDAILDALNASQPRPTGAGDLGTDQFFIGIDEQDDAIAAVGGENKGGAWVPCELLCDDGITVIGERTTVTYAIFLPPGTYPTEEPADSPVSLSGRVETTTATPLCAMVLASGQYEFSCDGSGNFSLSGLAREENGKVKRQVYADGFFPNIKEVGGSTSEPVTMQRSGTCPNYNQPYTPDAAPGSAGKRVDIRGSVLLGDSGSPICAMVLANGQYVFSCDGSGNYNMNVPLDAEGQFKLQVYADGFAPYTARFDESRLANDVRMARAAECK